MKITIFNVEHGACALVSSETGVHALIDCGYNSTTYWMPSYALPSMGVHDLDQLFITNYDEDHVANLPDLRRTVNIRTLNRNPTVSPSALRGLKMQDSFPGPGIDELIHMATDYRYPVNFQANWGDITFRTFWNSYPYDFEDENNLSMAVFVHHPRISVLFAGDLEIPGWKKLLQNPAFRYELSRVHVLLASHHGRRNGCCEELFNLGWMPQIVVISDDLKQYQTQETTSWYYARSSGISFDGDRRHVFTTRSDGDIFIEATSAGATIDTSSRQLMRIVKVLEY